MDLKQAGQEFLSGYFSTHDRRTKTKTAYTADLKQFQEFAAEGLDLHSLSGTVIEQWAAHLRHEGYMPASMRRKIATVKVFCSYWVRKGELKESPFWRVKLSIGRIQQLPKSLNGREMGALLSQARLHHSVRTSPTKGPMNAQGSRAMGATYRALRDLALVDLLFATGIRVGESSTLDLDDFVAQDGVFTIKGKGGRCRLAFVVEAESLQIQQSHLEARTRVQTDTHALFLNASGKRLSTQGIAKTIARLRREAGIERHVTPHMLRHTVATMLLRNGADVRVVQEFLGHASIATTQRYTHITKEHLIGVLRKFHPSMSLKLAG
jgi:site-specific recombinase XerD